MYKQYGNVPGINANDMQLVLPAKYKAKKKTKKQHDPPMVASIFSEAITPRIFQDYPRKKRERNKKYRARSVKSRGEEEGKSCLAWSAAFLVIEKKKSCFLLPRTRKGELSIFLSASGSEIEKGIVMVLLFF